MNWLSEVERLDLLDKLYSITKDERLGLIPALSAMELEQLQSLFHPRWDGNIISKSIRDELVAKGLVDRWNGMNFISKLGMVVLDTLGMVDEDWEAKLHRNCWKID